MAVEYKLQSGTYRVERSFTGTKKPSELIRERIIRAGRKAITEAVHTSPALCEKHEKIS